MISIRIPEPWISQIMDLLPSTICWVPKHSLLLHSIISYSPRTATCFFLLVWSSVVSCRITIWASMVTTRFRNIVGIVVVVDGAPTHFCSWYTWFFGDVETPGFSITSTSKVVSNSSTCHDDIWCSRRLIFSEDVDNFISWLADIYISSAFVIIYILERKNDIARRFRLVLLL